MMDVLSAQPTELRRVVVEARSEIVPTQVEPVVFVL
jgi:hypothetical protein